MSFNGQVALITGASSGIGRATAEAMARQGARVAVNYCKNRTGAEAAVAGIQKSGGEALAVRADVTRSDDVRALVEKVRARWGRVDILGNNAGDLLARRTLADMTEKYLAAIPMGRAGSAEEVAEVIAFLASPAARYITGETVEVNGGMWMD